MTKETILKHFEQGRTDLVFELLKLPDWKSILHEGDVKPMQWFVYYNDTTALRAVLDRGGDLSSLHLGDELGNAAFFGHWKVCDLLVENGADVNALVKDTGETPLHSALCKAGRPYYIHVVRLLLENGAAVNARTIPGQETGAFMRDVRTKGETPLHRAAAFADAATIELLLQYGADREARDVNGDSPLTWASYHLRPARILALLCFGSHRIHPAAIDRNISDHGVGWGNGMETNLLGEYVPFSKGGFVPKSTGKTPS